MKCEYCSRTALAKGLCNTHYLRRAQGRDMSKPIQLRGGVCLVPGCSKRNYAFGLCLQHARQYRWWKFKTELMRLKGNKCVDCQQTYPPAAYDFHHRDRNAKSFAMGNALQNKSWGDILVEAEKCDLLCANRHRIREYGKDTIWPSLKMRFRLF
jgi:hypothetical protein